MQRDEGLSIIIPCLNEELTIEHCVRQALDALQGHGIAGEVLVVDNNSVDRSIALAEAAGARVISETTRGYGAAYRAGIRNARYRYCVKGDADGSYDFNQIGEFYARLRLGDCDLVIGSRFKGRIMPGAMPPHHRYFGTPALTTLVNCIYGSRLTDINSGMRGFATQALLDLNLQCDGMEFASEMLVKGIKNGLRLCEIPITLHKDLRDRKPHLRSFRDGWRHLRFILLMSPLGLFCLPGLLSIVFGVLFSLVLLHNNAPQPDAGLTGARSLFGVTTFACLQSLILLGEILLIFSYISKLLLIERQIDLPDARIAWMARYFTLDRVLVVAAAGLVLNAVWTAIIAWRLYGFYAAGQFTIYTTMLGMLNFTAYVFLIILFFSAFFIAGFRGKT